MAISSYWPPSPQTLEAFNLLPRTSQNPFILLILLFHSPLALLFFTFKSLFHPNDIVIRTKQFSRIGSCGRMRRPLRVESRENLATFSYDLETWTLGITMSHIHSSCYSRFGTRTIERPSDNYLWNQFWWGGQISVDSGRNGPFEEKIFSSEIYLTDSNAVFNWLAAFRLDSFHYHTVLTKYIQIIFS